MFDIIIDEETANNEVVRLMDLKKTKPKRREALKNIGAIGNVVEAIQLGLVTIAEDGSITQTLITPAETVKELKFVAHVSMITINSEIGKLKNVTVFNTNMVYIKAYTGLSEGKINQLEANDRETAECIALFLQ